MEDKDRQNYRKQAAEGKKWCSNCKHYFKYFCMGDTCCECKIYGSFQIDHCPNPNTCKDYESNGQEPWYERM